MRTQSKIQTLNFHLPLMNFLKWVHVANVELSIPSHYSYLSFNALFVKYQFYGQNQTSSQELKEKKLSPLHLFFTPIKTIPDTLLDTFSDTFSVKWQKVAAR